MTYEPKTDWKYDDTVTEDDFNRIEGELYRHHQQLTKAQHAELLLSEGVQAVNVLSDSALNVAFEGRTVVNYAPPFTSREWELPSSATILEEGRKLQINEAGRHAITVRVGSGKDYTISGLFSGRIVARENDSNGAIIFDEMHQEEFKYFHKTFPVPEGVEAIFFNFNPTSLLLNFPYFVENFSLNEGTEALPYVRGVQHTRNPYVIASGKNLARVTKGVVTETGRRIIQLEGSSDTSVYNSTRKGIWGSLDGTVQQIGELPQLVPNTTYTFQVKADTAGGGICRIFYTDGSNTEFVNRYVENFEITHATSDPNKTIQYIGLGREGSYDIDNLQLELGSEATPFQEHQESYLFGVDVTLAEGEKAYRKNGEWRRWQTTEIVELDGSLDWIVVGGTFNGFKLVQISNIVGNLGAIPSSLNMVGVKFDGKILNPVSKANAEYTPQDIDTVRFSTNNLYVAISNQDSGWGPDYNPTPEELKALFMGWKMFLRGSSGELYNGTGQKRWAKIWNGEGERSHFGTIVGELSDTLPTTMNDMGWTPYRLHFKRAEPREVPVEFEGALKVHEGLNQIEVGTGVVVRENNLPYLQTTSGLYYLNANLEIHRLQQRVDKIFNVYEGVEVFGNSSIYYPSGEATIARIGKEQVTIKSSDIDLTKVYSLTYTVLDKHLFTAGLGGIEAIYNTNFATRLEENEKTLIEQVRKVSVLENELFPLLGSSEVVDHNLHVTNPPLGHYVRYANGLQICMSVYKPDWAASGTQEVISPASFVGVISGGFLLPSTTTKTFLEYFTDVFVMPGGNGWRVYIPENPHSNLVAGDYGIHLLMLARWK